jgi:PglZ domain
MAPWRDWGVPLSACLRPIAEPPEHWSAAEAQSGALLRVEDVLDRVVRPILDRGKRVLLLVVDGMSMAAATEFVESLTRNGSWLELTPDGGQRVGVLAALPTITEVSRFSLLAGRIAAGTQAQERAAFAHRFPDGLLLHKAALRAGAGSALDSEVTTALADPGRGLVAAVVNTIDDALDRSDPGTIVWSDETIVAVRDLLSLAQDRVVVLVSDHGHVIDRGPDALQRAQDTSENRWRPATTPPGDGEVLVHGSRVAKAGGRVVLPWREELRYGPRKAGYHGGAAPAEAVIPLMVLSAGVEDAVPGWAGAPVASPDWWREPLAANEAPIRLSPQRRGPARPAPLPDERVAALLTVLIRGNGRATLDTLAAHAGVPAHRIRGSITELMRLLQVEGYPVLTVDPDGQTVKLDTALMVEQFQL